MAALVHVLLVLHVCSAISHGTQSPVVSINNHDESTFGCLGISLLLISCDSPHGYADVLQDVTTSTNSSEQVEYYPNKAHLRTSIGLYRVVNITKWKRLNCTCEADET